MFQLSASALPFALLAAGFDPAAAACDGVASTFAGECNLANFQAGLTADCTLAELFPDAAADDYAAEVADACAYDAPTAFVEIQGTYQRDRRYFAGGGPLVDGGDWDRDAARLGRFEAHAADATLIGFPEYAARVQYNANQGLGDNGYPANMNLETSCDLNTVMCCFIEGDFDGNNAATTDVCRHDLSDSPQSNHVKNGWSVFPGDQTATHCVGFTWEDNEDELLGNMMYDVSLRNSLNKGYLKAVPGAPMCGCVEHMPVVEEAACRTATKAGDVTYTFTYTPATEAEAGYLSASNSVDVIYEDCAEADLKAQYQANHADDADAAALIDAHLVGAGGCAADVVEYLNEEQFLVQSAHDSKYLTPNAKEWSDLIVGEGIYFMPAATTQAEADGRFRGLVDGGCQEDDGSSRYCIVRRVCATCYPSHRDIYYKRKTALPTADVHFLDLFMNNWVSAQNSMAAGDFELYSTYEDALAGTNAWTYCNYNDSGIGFPRDCGPTGYVPHQWNSFTRSGGHANHHGWFVERP